MKASATPEPGTSGRPATLASAKARQFVSEVDTSRRSPQWALTREGLCNAGARGLRPPRHAHVDEMRQCRVVARMHRLAAGVAGHQRPQPEVRRLALPCDELAIDLGFDICFSNVRAPPGCQRRTPPAPAAKSAPPHAALQANL